MKLALSLIATSVLPLVFCLGSDDEFSVSNSRRGRGDKYDSFFDIRQIDADFASSRALRIQLEKINDILKFNHRRYAFREPSFRSNSHIGEHGSNDSNELYRLFKSCSYLVNPRFFSSYEHAIENKEYVDCYYLILKTVRPDCQVRKYIDILEAQTYREQIVEQNAIFLSASDAFKSFDLKCFKEWNICPSDIVLDICQIYNMNLYDRKALLKLLFKHHLVHADISGSEWNIFIARYTNIFLCGKPEDIRFTTFIFYYLYTDVLTGTLNNQCFTKLNRMMDDYERKSKKVQIILKFFYKLTFGKC